MNHRWIEEPWRTYVSDENFQGIVAEMLSTPEENI
jgi:hypothetical protein